ncbi:MULTISPECIES: malto-oligosyltrehalose synthase [unclassified Streptomyces]|uniref:malto-oligosyltrehalose synthase n=1 Tax=unclassified Streptomyces TaxID=2593676 RepID=UPI0022B6BD7B|nr:MULTISPECIES: malto-oligosyltrehalose synthase [unclassified Streptomyces]MCZ7415959.1 malto-oligosyltrehalose synthase [Streptomyces sp. WMMC897]MCZ7434232.1 malto-oligosyltrehalose synthase [Streptomyces sp. WMMC1477]
MRPPRLGTPVPTATYRLQLQPAYPFAAAARDVPAIASLGASHLHLSPVLEAVPGSTHGYDITDHTRVRAELGGEAGLRALSRTAREHGLGLVLDIVPNHMAVPAPAALNAPLWSVLADGPSSPYAHWFDIDWEAGDGRVLLPVLGGRLGEELAALRVEDGVLHYAEHRFPVRVGTESLPLPELLDAQHYRLAWWRLARTELNYRRFFSVSELIGVRVEEPDVFEATHERVLALLAEGVVDGLRVDHPDGLADPGAYLRRLHTRTGGAWTVVEKILGPDERLSVNWPVAGTTGYDALRHIDAVFVDPDGAARLTDLYRDFTQVADDLGGDWAATVRRAAHEVIGHELDAEVRRLVRTARAALARADGQRRGDHADWTLAQALRELLVRLPVYRLYRPPDDDPVLGDAFLTDIAPEARATFTVPEEAATVDVVSRLILRDEELATRFAQVSGALRAKSVEDTAFYRYLPLLSAAEVGGEPGEPALPPAAFHAYCAYLQRERPDTGTVLSTHDTKRSADVRAALATLSEDPAGWGVLLRQVTEEVAGTGGAALDRHTAWLVWQTAHGLGTPDRERLLGALLKAVREAGLHTTWTEPDADYEAAVERYLDAGPCGAGRAALAAYAEATRPQARVTALGMTLLHLTMPGVPDLYQGTERTYRALVDPDNRRPPVFPAPESEPDDEKLRLTQAALRLRARHPHWFGAGARYAPLTAHGPAAEHCLAFGRGPGDGGDAGADSLTVVTVVTRLSRRLAEAGGWRGTVLPLPPGRWRDLLSTRPYDEGRADLASLLAEAPVALLVRE